MEIINNEYNNLQKLLGQVVFFLEHHISLLLWDSSHITFGLVIQKHYMCSSIIPPALKFRPPIVESIGFQTDFTHCVYVPSMSPPTQTLSQFLCGCFGNVANLHRLTSMYQIASNQHLITTPKQGKGYSIRLLHMLHRRFANASQVSLCKQKWHKSGNTKTNKTTPKYIE